MKNILAVSIAFVLGIAFGHLLLRPSPVHAQMGGVIVTEAVQTQGRIPNPVSGTVVGFSCTRDTDGGAACFIATQ